MHAKWIQRLVAVGVVLTAFSGSASTTTSYGKELSGVRVVRIAELVSSPEKYLGEKVRVEGLVEDICPMEGCWIDILESQSRETIRFKVADGVIVFPVEAKGREVVAEGVAAQARDVEEAGDIVAAPPGRREGGTLRCESSVTGPMVFYQIEGLGAEVTE